MRIALLDDDPAQLVQLTTALKVAIVRDDEISCVTFSLGETLRRALRRETFDVLVLDWNVPDLDGTALLQWLRKERGDDTPVIMLSSRASEKDVAAALRIGADDYIIKPFRPIELRARIERLVTRRSVVKKDNSARFGDWTFDGVSKTVVVDTSSRDGASASVSVALRQREYQLALVLFQNLGKAVSRNYLIEKSGYESEESPSRALDSHIYRLRKKLALDGTNGLWLQTLYGHGYMLVTGSGDHGTPPREGDVIGDGDGDAQA